MSALSAKVVVSSCHFSAIIQRPLTSMPFRSVGPDRVDSITLAIWVIADDQQADVGGVAFDVLDRLLVSSGIERADEDV